MDRLWVEAIKETMDEYVKEIIYENAKQEAAAAVYAALRDKIPGGITLSIEYKTLKAAA
jgi:hypothetical protein